MLDPIDQLQLVHPVFRDDELQHNVVFTCL